MPLISHPYDGKLHSNYGRYQRPANKFESVQSSDVIKNRKGHEEVNSKSAIDENSEMLRAKRSLDSEDFADCKQIDKKASQENGGINSCEFEYLS